MVDVPSALLVQVRVALIQGDKTTARSLLTAALRANPHEPEAWLLMSGIVETPAQQRDCLSRVLTLDPTNAAAQRGLAMLEGQLAPAPAVTSPTTIKTLNPTPLALSGAPSSVYAPPPVPPYSASQPPAAAYNPALVGEMGMAAPFSKRTSPVLKALLMVGVGLVVLLLLLAGLSALGRKTTAGVPPTPKISAPDRATGFINSLMANYSNPAFFDQSTIDQLARPAIDKYLVPEGREKFLGGLRIGILTMPERAEMIQIAPLIKQIYVADLVYSVRSQSPTRIVLDVTGGDLWVVTRDGRAVKRPMRDMYHAIYLRNLDGVWYIEDIDIGSF